VSAWHEGVDRDLGRLTAELAQRAAAIDDAHAAIDDLRAADRIEDLEAAIADLRDDHATLLDTAGDRELRAFAIEGRLAALEAAAEALADRVRVLEAGAEAAVEEARRLRAAVDRPALEERLRALERRVEAGDRSALADLSDRQRATGCRQSWSRTSPG
jgi:chromosome segregation ATPase